VAVTITLAEGLPPVMIDHGQFEQVILNLAVNARDAMPEGGILSISTSTVVVDEPYLQGRPGMAPGRYAQLEISDSGTGMDAATLERVFEPFYTTKGPGEGTGLGLTGVYGIVTQAAGRVSIYSEPGHGTTITVLLPATEASAAASVPQAPTSHRPATETILLVEDYDDLREVMAETLQRGGYQVLAASDGPAALEIAEQHSGPIDLLLTDVVLPLMMGTDLADKVSGTRPQLRVLFMSGYAHPLLDARGTLEPDVHLIQKPFMESALLEKLRQVLEAAPTVAT
jgi:CheY-like chemotaxis protein